MPTTMLNRLLPLAFATLISIAALSTARAVDPPAIVNYQGVLFNAAGSPVNGSYNMIFRFFDSESGSGELLADSHIGGGAVAVANGVFSLQLGGGTVSGQVPSLTELLASFATVYLEVEVEGEALTPRIRIVSSFYALNSANLGGRSAEEFVDVEGDQVKTGNLTLNGIDGGGILTINGGGKLKLNEEGSDLTIENGSKVVVQAGGNVLLQNEGSDIRVEKGSKLMVQDGGSVLLQSPGSDIVVEKGSQLKVQDGGGVLLQSVGSDIVVEKGSQLKVQDGGGVLLQSVGSDIVVEKGSQLKVQDGGGVLLQSVGSDIVVEKGSQLKVQDGGGVLLQSVGSDIVVEKGSQLKVQDGGGVLLQSVGSDIVVEKGSQLKVQAGGGVLLQDAGSDIVVEKGSKLKVQAGGGVLLQDAGSDIVVEKGSQLKVQAGGGVLLQDAGSDIVVEKGSKLKVQAGGGVLLQDAGSDIVVEKGSQLKVQAGGNVLLQDAGSDIVVEKGSQLKVQAGGNVVLDGTSGGARLTVENGADIVVKGAQGQSAPLQQWQDSNGVVRAAVSPTGGFSGDGSGLMNIHAADADTLNGLASTAFARLASPNTFANTQAVQLLNPAATGLVVQGAANQTATLQEWRNDSGAVLAAVDSLGGFVGSGASMTGVNADKLDNIDSTGFARLGTSNSFATGTQTINTGNSSTIGLIVKGSPGQTMVSLQQWQDGAGNVRGSIDTQGRFTGNFFVGSGALLTNLNATNLTGTIASSLLSGTYSGQLIFDNATNSFTGNGQGLTNVVADVARRVNEKRVAVVVEFLESGSPTPGSHYYTSLSDALDDTETWCGVSTPCVVQITPGHYYISEEIAMVPDIDVVGSGENSTFLHFNSGMARIVSAPNSMLSSVELILSDNAPALELSAGTVRHVSIGTGVPRSFLVNISGSGVLEDATLEGGTPSLHVSGGSPTLRNVRISATDGIQIDGGSSPTLSDVLVAMTPNAGAAGTKGIMIQGGAMPSMDGVTITGTSVSGMAVVKGIHLQSVAPSPKMKNVVIRLSGPGTLTGVELGGSTITLDDSVIEVESGSPMRGILVVSSSIALRGSRVRSGGAGSSGIEISGSGSSVKVDQCVIAAEGPTTAAIVKPSGNTVLVGASKLDAVITVSGGGPPSALCVFSYNGNYLPLNSTCN